eukprot:TRINITY_DN5113_c0_g2_i1.p1 TRINITY_DN5113_c0_g2~~TRINITY_DN5113_c0_g2_i1.p1  ORF type:complete len:311 (-),score=27.28 TRINITY_DN5113_c0_g2_i1:441-1373(-)
MALLQEDDWLVDTLAKDVPYVYADDIAAPDNNTPLTIRNFDIMEHLGTANFTSIYRVVRTRKESSERQPTEEFAAKVYSTAFADGDFLKDLHFLHAVQSHPNIMALCTVQERPTRAIVVPCYECDLDGYVHRQDHIHEGDSALLMLGLLKAVRHIHSRRILHRNIKPGNIAVSRKPHLAAVLLNFSCACHSWDHFSTQARFGAIGYVAPEVLLGCGFSSMSDVFSVGCVLYFIVQRRSPFNTDPPDELASLRLTALCEYELHEGFETASQNCKALVRLLLVRKPASRLSAEMSLAHPWISTAAIALSGSQ